MTRGRSSTKSLANALCAFALFLLAPCWAADLSGDALLTDNPVGQAVPEGVRRIRTGASIEWDEKGEYACDSECLRLAEGILTAGLPEGSFLTADCEMDLVDLIWPLLEG